MTSTRLTHVSLVILGAAGGTLLFAGAEVLPTVFGGPDAWLAQLVASGWLGVAMLNWLHRRSIVGGIHGRPLVMANLMTYLVVSTTLVKASGSPLPESVRLGGAAVAGVLAMVYGWLMMRGPFAADSAR